jgi:hypothetical protein
MSYTKAADAWPKCSFSRLDRCAAKARFWSGIEVHVIKKMNGSPKVVNDGFRFFCRDHCSNPHKWYTLQASDVREWLKSKN